MVAQLGPLGQRNQQRRRAFLSWKGHLLEREQVEPLGQDAFDALLEGLTAFGHPFMDVPGAHSDRRGQVDIGRRIA
jgi:hypothetical protein